MFDLKHIDTSWTLFLDRDGVINIDKEQGYILKRDEFVFYNGVKDALKILSNIFSLIIIVTNQKGIGKKLMTENDLFDIHNYMTNELKQAGGRIDKIYFSADLDNYSPYRKPQAGMAYQAKKDFPQINFSKSIMVGNRLTDMEFGRNAGVNTVFIASTDPETPFPYPSIDARYNSLLEFAHAIDNK